MLTEVVAALACPVCGERLQEAQRSLTCSRGHAFDIARQGHVTLRAGAGPRHGGDDAAMVDARVRFLASGAYDGLAARIAEISARAYPGGGLVVDAGGGTGFYTHRVLDVLSRSATAVSGGRSDDDAAMSARGPVGLVLDASTPALGRAARAHPRLGAVGCDLWQRWPVRDEAAGVVLDVFAPRNGPETARVLTSGGCLVAVTPGAAHLAELVGPLGLLAVDPDKSDRVERSLGPYLHQEAAEPYEQRVFLGHPGVSALVAMGPSARHLPPADVADRIAQLPSQVEVTLSVQVSRWTKRSPS